MVDDKQQRKGRKGTPEQREMKIYFHTNAFLQKWWEMLTTAALHDMKVCMWLRMESVQEVLRSKMN